MQNIEDFNLDSEPFIQEMHNIDKDKIIFDDNTLSHLISSIKSKKAVVFVGAGASKAANLPDWKGFLNDILTSLEEENNLKPKYSLKMARKLFNEYDFVLSAELIESQIKGKLSDSIDNVFSKENEPSPIHYEITRIPFSFAITTNFDKLLEKAYQYTEHAFTWTNISDFFKKIKDNQFRILKSHGDSEIALSQIIKKGDFNTIIQNKKLNSHISNFLVLNTFLFIGNSFRDPDLIELLNTTKDLYGRNFGPHYAILFEDEIDNALIDYFDSTYGIKVIEIKESDPKRKTFPVVSFLRYLSGKVANYNFKIGESIILNSEIFNFNRLIKRRLNEITVQLGANKTTLLIIDSRDFPSLIHFFVGDKDSKNASKYQIIDSTLQNSIQYYSIIKTLYQLGSQEPISFYIPNSNDEKCYPKIPNLSFNKQIINPQGEQKSLLLTQVFSDGQCIGVIMVESNIVDAFTKDYLASLKNITSLVSSPFKELELRNSNIEEINLSQNAKNLQNILDSYHSLKEFKLNYLFYEIDYRQGLLKAHFDSDKIFHKKMINPSEDSLNFFFNFGEESFAYNILKNSKDDFCSNINNGIKSKQLAKKGIETFRIKNSIYGTPIRSGKNTSFVLIVWSDESIKKKDNKHLYKIKDRIFRTAHLISNSNFKENHSFENARKFIDTINENLKTFNGVKPWKFRILDPEFRIEVIDTLLSCLTEKPCSLARVRLWSFNEKENKFVCIYSYCSAKSFYPNKGITSNKNNYLSGNDENRKSDINDEYCQFTYNRFAHNPYAMYQRGIMFGNTDKNSTWLNKDPDGKWIVGPIVHTEWDKSSMDKKNPKILKKTLLGYISADNHININGIPKEDTSISHKHYEFQKYAIDCISELLTPILNSYNFHTYNTFRNVKVNE